MTVTSVTSQSEPTNTGSPENKTASHNTGTIVGATVGGAVGAILILALILWRFCRHRDREATSDEIRWPELKPDHDMTGAAMQPLPARRTGGAGFDMGEESDAELDEEEEAAAAAAAAAAGGGVAHMGGERSSAQNPFEPADDFGSDQSGEKYGQHPVYGVTSSTALTPNAEGYGNDAYAYEHPASPVGGSSGLARGPSLGAATSISGTHAPSTATSGYGAAGIGAGVGARGGGMQELYYEGAGQGDSYVYPQHSQPYYGLEEYPDYNAGAPPAQPPPPAQQPTTRQLQMEQQQAANVIPASLEPGMTFHHTGFPPDFMDTQYAVTDTQGYMGPYGSANH